MNERDYAQKAKEMTDSELFYALSDINETLQIHREKDLNDPYVKKLYAEHDAYIVEVQKRHYK